MDIIQWISTFLCLDSSLTVQSHTLWFGILALWWIKKAVNSLCVTTKGRDEALLALSSTETKIPQNLLLQPQNCPQSKSRKWGQTSKIPSKYQSFNPKLSNNPKEGYNLKIHLKYRPVLRLSLLAISRLKVLIQCDIYMNCKNFGLSSCRSLICALDGNFL